MSTPARIGVVHLINHLGYGGTERQLFLVLRHFESGGRFEHRVVVFNPSPERVYDDALAEIGVEVVHLPEDCVGIVRRVAFLTGKLRAWRSKVVHSWTVHDNPYAGLAGRLAGAPARWGSLRGTFHSDGLRRQSWWRRRAMLHGVQRIVVNSTALAGELRDAGVAPERILRLPNCVLPAGDSGPADLSDLGIGDEPLVGIVGNLRAVKNHRLFVRAMARVLENRPGVKALLVGQPLDSEPEYQRTIEAQIEESGLGERIVLTGFRDDVPRILARLSVLCLTSRSEGLPNAVLEAMASGLPVVACRVGGLPDLIDDGVHGFLVDPDDEVALAERVGRLLDDRELARTLGAAGRARASSEFACEAAARTLAHAYLEALGEESR